MDLKVIPLENIGLVEPYVFGYIDEEGNFYSLGKAKRNYLRIIDENSCTHMEEEAIKIASSLPLTEEEKQMQARNSFRTSYPWLWPANKVLENHGFKRFFRCYIDEDEGLIDYSSFENATTKQLYVLNYLFALNHIGSTDIEKRRALVAKSFVDSLNCRVLERKL